MSASATAARSRRALLIRAGTAAFGALVARSLGAEPARAQPTTSQPAITSEGSEASLIATLLQVEQAVSVAYRTVMGSGRLGTHTARRLRAPYAQQLEHVRMLRRQLAALQPDAFVAPQSGAEARQLFASHHFATSLTVRSERDALNLLAGAEDIAIGASFKAMSQLASASLLRAVAEMMASDAQHLAVIGQLQYPTDITRALPDPFVQGKA